MLHFSHYVIGECHYEGETVCLSCEVPAEHGFLQWDGFGFSCTSSTSGTDNIITLQTDPCSVLNELSNPRMGECGLYSGNLTCSEDGSYVTSTLYFKSNYTMNGETIKCLHHGVQIMNFSLRIGGKVTQMPYANFSTTLYMTIYNC